jgi:hypothetical protein
VFQRGGVEERGKAILSRGLLQTGSMIGVE